VAAVALFAVVGLAELAPAPLSDSEQGCGSSAGACRGEPVSLLQVNRATETPLLSRMNFRATTPDQRLKLLKPLVWVHIAKTGSGILNTLYNMDGICPLAPQAAKDAVMSVEEEEFYDLYPPQTYCPGSFNLSFGSVGHLGFGPYFEGNEGHAIAMFRQPEQRAISAYYWSASKDFKNTPTLANATVKQYALAMQGCQTKMLALDTLPEGPSPCVENYEPPTEEMVQVALYRLRNGFAFTGLTDEWDLSMCLFHAKFGGECISSEFTNTRPGPEAEAGKSLYDTSELEGFTDPSDALVYAEAKAMFEEDLQRLGVSHESCQSWCYSKVVASADAVKA